MGPTGIARRIFGHDARAPWVVAAAVAFLLIPVPGPILDAVLVSSFGAAALHLATAVDPPARRTAAGFGTLTTGLVLLRTALAFGLTRRVLSGEPADGLAAALGTSLSPFGPIAGLAVLGALALVHLLVVARGVERAAQVAARFALDALPGRQLALESAGRTGEADPETLRRRRAALAADAAEAGAMDGAARFLRGEATAILALALLNALAGLALPVLGGDVPLADAWRAPLAVAAGAGLATLLPALLSGLAVGVFLARHRASEGEGEGDLGESLAGPAPAWAGAAACALVGALPGTPVVSTAAATAAFVALALRRGARSMPAAAEDPSAAGAAAAVVALHPGAMAALGPGGVDRVVDDVRAGLMRRHGLVLPVVNARTAPELPESGYVIEVMGTPVARGRLRAGAGLSLTAPPDALERHPTLGLPAAWTADGPLTPVAELTLAL
ncbi:FHIPEP family type III secretion protein, partial [Myxococcota bacterium]|nr:FHIPEP family type III secretion protein [Myxococcota bacterium]